MNLLVDTNRYRDYVGGDKQVLEQLRRCECVAICFITLAELRSGFLLGSQSRENERNLTGFLQKPQVDVVFADETTPHHYARLVFQLRRQGTPISTNDIWIAASAIQYDLTLYSRDVHFNHVPQIPRV